MEGIWEKVGADAVIRDWEFGAVFDTGWDWIKGD
jgi:hypothetical protein